MADYTIVPGALVPVQIDREADYGRYVEPNVWMRHDLESLKENGYEQVT